MATIGRVAVYAVLALIRVTPVAAQLATPEAAIRAQVQGFYRDDRDNRWPDVLDHFWVGKITARWTAPTSTQAWLAARPLERRSEEHTSELQSSQYLVCRLLLEKKKGRQCMPRTSRAATV